MLTYIVRRVLYSIPVLFLSTFLSFVVRLVRREPDRRSCGEPADPAELRSTTSSSSSTSNKPVVVRYFYWLARRLHAQARHSLIDAAADLAATSRGRSATRLQFILIAEVLALVLGVAVGIYSAIRQYSVFDYFFTSVSFLGFAMPTFWLALLLQIALHRHLSATGTSGSSTPRA